MDAKIRMAPLIIMFAVRPTCAQDSIFKMSSESPESGYKKMCNILTVFIAKSPNDHEHIGLRSKVTAYNTFCHTSDNLRQVAMTEWTKGIIEDWQMFIVKLTASLYIKPGPWFKIKMSSYQYRKSHCGDKMVIRSSYLHNGIFYTGKMTSLYWISPQL